MQQVRAIIRNYLSKIHIPSIRWTDVLEILIIAFLIYALLSWIKKTRAWSLLKGMIAISVLVLMAVLLNMTTILWLVQNVTSILLIGLIVILQPELRRGLSELGEKDFLRSLFPIEQGPQGLFSDKTINEIVRACTEMSKVKTGALIVLECRIPLEEYEKTGIEVDAVVTSQLLINIFEKNTPLHDGAVIIRGDRVTAATCYLPLTNSRIDKKLGTRHRAGLGMSEATDAMIVIVSEETGHISTAHKGVLTSNIDAAKLKNALTILQAKHEEEPAAPQRIPAFLRRGKGGDND